MDLEEKYDSKIEELEERLENQAQVTFGSARPQDIGAAATKPGIQVYPGTRVKSSEADDSEPYIDTTEVSRMPTALDASRSSKYNQRRRGSPLRVKKRTAQATHLKKLKKNKSSSKSLKKGTSAKSLKS